MTIDHDFSYDEIQRIHRILLRRFRKRPGLKSIGFGHARKEKEGGRIDEDRGLSVCFNVAKKLKPKNVPVSLAFDPQVVVRLRRGGRLQQISLPTDIVHSPKVIGSGRRLRLETETSFRFSTCGLQVRWSETDGSSEKPRIAFLTVGHVFRSLALNQVVELASSNGSFTVFGRLLARTNSNDGRDAALIEVTESSLNELAPPTHAPVRLATKNELIQNLGKSGELLRSDGTRGFLFGVFHPSYPDIDNVGTVKDVFEGLQGSPTTFAEGTSGAVWMLDGTKVACLQTAGFPDGFDRGLGQLAINLVGWIVKTITNMGNFVPGSLKFEAAF